MWNELDLLLQQIARTCPDGQCQKEPVMSNNDRRGVGRRDQSRFRSNAKGQEVMSELSLSDDELDKQLERIFVWHQGKEKAVKE
jgi:hypothetical protein